MARKNPISIMTFVFNDAIQNGQFSLEFLTAKLKAMGFDGLEIFIADLIENFKCYQHALKANDLKLSCIDAVSDLVSSDAAERQKAIDPVKVAIEMAGQFGCSQVMLAGSMAKPDVTPADGRKMIADAIASQVELAHQSGVVLMTEDFGMAPDLMCRAADCLEVLDMCNAPEQVKFTFDTGNFIFGGEDPEKNLELFLPRINHVHVKAWRPLAQKQPNDSGEWDGYIGCPVSEGLIPNESLTKRILDYGYDRWFSLECGALVDPIAGARRDYNSLNGWLSD